jgi:hypothetical protein
LTVSDAAPMQLTCPRCLAKIQRPTSVPAAQRVPVPAIPLDEEAKRDSRLAFGILLLIGIFVCVGVWVAMGATNAPAADSVAFAAVLVILVVVIILAAVALGPPKPAKTPPPLPPARAWEDSDKILQYSSIRRSDSPHWSGGAFAGGFFAALGVCAGGFFLLGATIDSRNSVSGMIFLVIVVIAVIATITMGVFIGRRRSMLGFTQGVAVGMCLGLLALGPCAFCYLMTLHG